MIISDKVKGCQFLILIGGLLFSFFTELRAQNDSLNQVQIEVYQMQVSSYRAKGDIEAAKTTQLELLAFLEESKMWQVFVNEKIRMLFGLEQKSIEEGERIIRTTLEENAEGDDLKSSLGKLYEYLGGHSYYAQKYKLSEQYFLKSYDYMKSMENPNYEYLETIVHSLSNVYTWSLGRVTDGIYYAKLSLEYAERVHGLVHLRTIHATGNLAVIYSFMGAHNEAIDYYKRGFTLIDKMEKTPELNIVKARFLGNMGMLLQNKNRTDEALKCYQEALDLQLEIENLGGAAFLYHSIGSLFANKGEKIKAEKFFLKSLEYVDYHNDPLQINGQKSSLYYSLGELKIAEKDTSTARKYFNQALSFLYINYPSKRMEAIASTYTSIAKLWMPIDLEQSRTWLKQAIVSCSPTLTLKEIDTDILAAIKKHKFFSKQELSNCLSIYNQALFKHYQKTKQIADLELAYKISEALLYLADEVQNELSNKEDQLAWLNTFHQVYESAIKISYTLYQQKQEQKYLNFAFELVERNKSMLLLQTIQQAEALKFGGVPDSLIHEEQWLKTKLSGLIKKRFDAIVEQQLPIEQQLDEEIFQVKETIKTFRAFLEQNYPKYHTLKYKKELTSIQDLQANSLVEGQAILEYFVTDEEIYIFYIDREVVKLYKQDIDGSLKKHVDRFRKGMSDFNFIQDFPQKSYDSFTEEAYWFYQMLVEPILKEQKVKKLIIVADGLLGHLPFETFLQKQASTELDYKNLDYLFKNYLISYAYSSTLWQHNLATTLKPKKQQILAFASSYPKGTGMPNMVNNDLNAKLRMLRASLNELPATQKEVKILEEMFEGQFWYEKEANEQNFKNTASDYAVIHLAMHGILNQELPMASSLAFSEDGDTLEDDFLHIYELSQLELNAQLVVLSACETGYGKFEQGEGIMSLARSFMYAGGQSLLMSLWQVNDQSTARIMNKFYANLSKGMPKDEALQQAKYNYLEDVKGIGAHPGFWAAFIQLGNPEAIKIDQKGSWNWWWFAGAMALLGTIILGILKRR